MAIVRHPCAKTEGFPLIFLWTQKCSANAFAPTLVTIVRGLPLACLASRWPTVACTKVIIQHLPIKTPDFQPFHPVARFLYDLVKLKIFPFLPFLTFAGLSRMFLCCFTFLYYFMHVDLYLRGILKKF